MAFDPSTDPVYAQVAAQIARADADARAAALASRKRQMIAYGDPTLAGQIDPQTAAAAQANPFSTLAELKQAYDQGLGTLNEGLNRSNLFYSSTRGQRLAGAARDYQGRQYGAAGTLQDSLDAIARNLAGTLSGDQSQLAGAYSDAYGRYLDHLPQTPPPAQPGANNPYPPLGTQAGDTALNAARRRSGGGQRLGKGPVL